MNDKKFCMKCGKTLKIGEFYQSHNLEKYPDGYLDQCKKCITMHVDNFDQNTYLWLLQDCDVPYIPEEWNSLLVKFGQTATRMGILGRYLSKMRLNQYKNFRWKDTEFLQQKKKKEIRESMEAKGYTEEQIVTYLEKNLIEVPEKIEKPSQIDEPIDLETLRPTAVAQAAEIAPVTAESLGLTPEEVNMLKIKWGSSYRPEEWIQLEKFYEEMMQSYDIQTAGHIDTLKHICKSSLRANQLIDAGDIEGYQKMTKVYNDLMKAGHFTAAQNKTETGDFVDSVSELVAICEKEGFIPRYYVTEPNDKVDENLRDMQRYTKVLITQETNLGTLIEQAIKRIEQQEKEEQEMNETDIFDPEAVERELRPEDYEEFSDFLMENEETDNENLKKFLELNKNGIS